ncbi:MAG: ADOP family duplicated permease [Gemmatimonadaceae bacterium]
MAGEPVWRRYTRFFGPSVVSDVDDEIEFHIEARAAEYVAQGVTPDAARARAVAEFGDMERAKQLCREIGKRQQQRRRAAEYVDSARQDLRYAVRVLRRSPGFAAAAVVTLALGIGANAAIFSLVNAVLLRPLPYHEPERLVRLWETTPQGAQRNVVSPGNYLDWRARAKSFAALGAHTWSHGIALAGEGEPRRVMTTGVTPSLLAAIGVVPMVGRLFGDEEARAADVVLLSDGLWRTHFGADRRVIGRRIVLDERPHTVVGVMPPHFDFPSEEIELWRPVPPGLLNPTQRRGHNLFVVGRLASGATIAGAQAEMSTLAAALARQYPEAMAGWGVNVVSLHGDLVAAVRPLLLVLLGGVGLILLIACANIANLLLARAATREREMAVRGALGAERGRLVRQLLTEGLVLATAGGLLGLAIAPPVLRGLIALAPGNIPLLDDVRIDPTVLGFAAAATLFSTALFALAPALRLARADLQATLRASQGSAAGLRHARLRSALLVAEVALSLVLLIGAGLLLRSARRLSEVDHGFRADGLLTVSLDLPRVRYDSTPKHVAFYGLLLERVRAIPGVAGVAATSEPPATGANMTFSFAIEGRRAASPSGREAPQVLHVVTPEYFRVLGVPLVRGRAFDDRDRAGAPAVAIVNRALARLHWPTEAPLGRRISFAGPEGPWLQIVGVVGDTRMVSPDLPPAPAVYIPHAQKEWHWLAWMTLMVRADSGRDPRSLAPAVQTAVWELDRRLAIHEVATVDDLYGESTARRRFATTLLTTFAALALFLGTVGMYGVLSYAVAQRRREIGIRLALGAGARQVMRAVLGQALGLTALGVIIGTGGALALTRLLGTLLYEVSPTDPITYAGVASLLALVAALAAWMPAWRATRIDPLVVLREA